MKVQTVMAAHFICTWFFLVEIFIKLINDFRNFWLEGFEVLNFILTTSSCYVFVTSVCFVGYSRKYFLLNTFLVCKD